MLDWVINPNLDKVTKEQLHAELLKAFNLINTSKEEELVHRKMLEKALKELALLRTIFKEINKNKDNQTSELLKLLVSYEKEYKEIWKNYIL